MASPSTALTARYSAAGYYFFLSCFDHSAASSICHGVQGTKGVHLELLDTHSDDALRWLAASLVSFQCS